MIKFFYSFREVSIMKKKLQTTFSTRQYMLSKDFEIYYYDDAHLTGVKAHSHNYYEFYFFLQGNISMIIGDKTFSLKTGDVILIPPGISHHAVNCDESVPYRRFVFWVSEDYYQQLCTLSSDYNYIVDYALQNHRFIYHNDVISFNNIQALLFHLLEEIHTKRFGREAKLAVSVNDLVIHLNRMAYEQNNPSPFKKNQGLYENLLAYIESHLEEDLTLDHLADAFYVSKFHISHIFKENLGLSVHQYITKKRLSMCRDALLSDTNIGNIILMYGFKDYSSFYRAFKKEYGQSPTEYKELHRISEIQ